MFAFGHLIGGWTLGKLFELFTGTDLTRTAWIILLFCSLLPDLDLIYDWIFKQKTHRTFTHSIFFIFFISIIGFFILKIINLSNEFIFIALGILSHIILDMISNNGVMLLWPYRGWFSFFKNKKNKNITITRLKYQIKFLLFDSVLGLIWLGYLYFAGRIILS